ncbi:MAG: F0F1 ATP synthase subunit beta, partial [Novosphingobium sp.]|nr:F0F1 ATP synthase subunit beta [Novosphingobium sp.]
MDQQLDQSANAAASASSGRIVAVRGAVIDVAFPKPPLPPIEDALHVRREDGSTVVAEVQAHLDEHHLRAIAIEPTAGLRRGDDVAAAGGPIDVPVGEKVLGRLIGVTGNVADGGAPFPDDTPRWPIHRQPPPLKAQTGATDLFMTGIKAIDLLTPLAQGGKAAMFGGAGVG